MENETSYIFFVFFLIWLLLPLFFFWKAYRDRNLRKSYEALKKLRAKHEEQLTQQTEEISASIQQISELGGKIIKEQTTVLTKSLTPQNYSSTKQKLHKLIDFCKEQNYSLPKEEEHKIFQTLKKAYEDVVRRDIAKQEQARIKERIREEQKLIKERAAEIRRMDAEQLAVQKALDKALKEIGDEHNAEVLRLREQLQVARERFQRAKSQAELTKAGHVYVISNIGSFGDNVFKIGMTRRLEPLNRVKELGDASVPFAFDVHLMVSCDDAPKLENALHKELHKFRLNKVNLRKEFFKIDLTAIVNCVKRNHGVVEYKAEPEAFEYNETLSMSEDDYEFISQELAEAFEEDVE
jgi:uncharacterized protein (DUF1778 family)